MLARIGFPLVKWQSRHGLRDEAAPTPKEQKNEALRTGVRRETFAYWFLRRLGCIFIARNYMPAHTKRASSAAIASRAFVEVRTRLTERGKPALPELSITKEKHEDLVRTAHYFLRQRHLKGCPGRFASTGDSCYIALFASDSLAG